MRLSAESRYAGFAEVSIRAGGSNIHAAGHYSADFGGVAFILATGWWRGHSRILMSNRRQNPWRLFLAALLFGGATILSAQLGTLLSVSQSTYVSFWLPAGLYLGVLLLNETRDWPWFVLAAIPSNFLFDWLSGTPIGANVGFDSADTLEALAGAWLVRRFVADRPRLTTLKEFFGLAGYGAILSPVVGASIGAAALTLSGISQSFLGSWITWWSNSAMAILLVTPLMLVWFTTSGHKERPFATRGYFLEVALLTGALIGFSWYMLVMDRGINGPYKPLLLLLLLWAGLRFGLRGATAANFFFALLMAFFTTHFLKGLTTADAASGAYLIPMRSFLMMSVVIVLIPTIVVAERNLKVVDLKDSEERFRILTQAAFECICISENGIICDINDQGLSMFGYTRKEMLGKPIAEMVAPEWRATVIEAIRSDRESLYGHALMRKDGSIFFAEAQAKIIRMGNRTLRMTALRDVTERKQAEEALEKSEERFRRAFDDAPIGMALVSPEGRWLKVNRVLCDMVGYSEPELLQIDFQHVTHPDDLQADLGYARQVLAGEIPSYQMEKRYFHKNGTQVSVMLSVSLVRNRAGEPLYFVSHIENITERKQREEERENLITKLQQALAEVKTLSGMLPICTNCKKIRDDKGYWNQVELYVMQNSNATFSHGICPDCSKTYFAEIERLTRPPAEDGPKGEKLV